MKLAATEMSEKQVNDLRKQYEKEFENFESAIIEEK